VVKVTVGDYQCFWTKPVFGIARGIGRLDAIIEEQLFIYDKSRSPYFACPA
jgi:hypothetical protein